MQHLFWYDNNDLDMTEDDGSRKHKEGTKDQKLKVPRGSCWKCVASSQLMYYNSILSHSSFIINHQLLSSISNLKNHHHPHSIPRTGFSFRYTGPRVEISSKSSRSASLRSITAFFVELIIPKSQESTIWHLQQQKAQHPVTIRKRCPAKPLCVHHLPCWDKAMIRLFIQSVNQHGSVAFPKMEFTLLFVMEHRIRVYEFGSGNKKHKHYY